eukprot:2228929-Pyramimonas_sp.AAC.1
MFRVRGGIVNLGEAGVAHRDGLVPTGDRLQEQMARLLAMNGRTIKDFVVDLHNESVKTRSDLLLA